MREVLDELIGWWQADEPVALATVVATFGSAPRAPGASMLRGPDDSVVGSLSGGCVEAEVYELAGEVLAEGTPALRRYGISDDDAFAVGLTCGGDLEIYVEPVTRTTFPELADLAADVAAGRPVALATVVAHPDAGRIGRRLVVRPVVRPRSDGSTPAVDSPEDALVGEVRDDATVRDDALGLLAAGTSALLTYGPDVGVFVRAFAPPPRLIVFGAIDFAAAVARVGAFLGYRVTVCDARAVFATPTRFPGADEVIVDQPHRYLSAEHAAGRVDDRTVITVLTHDPRFDVPLLDVALRLPSVGYVGAMGSRRTHDDRIARLREAGVSEAELARLASPIGLDLGARTPEETAISIAAEFIAAGRGGTGEKLAATAGRIHR